MERQRSFSQEADQKIQTANWYCTVWLLFPGLDMIRALIFKKAGICQSRISVAWKHRRVSGFCLTQLKKIRQTKAKRCPVPRGTHEKRSAHECLPCFRRIFAIEIIRGNKTNQEPMNKLDSGREIQKSKLHTQKISLEFHEHKVY